MDFNSPDIYRILDESNNIAISAHLSPDGDAVGSCAAMALALEMIGKKPVIFLEKYNDKFKFLKGLKFVTDQIHCDRIFDLFISLDCGSKDRLSGFQVLFDNARKTMVIDHHISNTLFGDINIVYPNASSTCQVVYEIIKNFCNLNKDIAEALYTGILTDTNGFMHTCTSTRTHEIAAQLLMAGISSSELHERLLYSHSVSEMRICGYAFSKAVIDDKICYCQLSRDEIENRCGAQYSELDTIVSYLLNCNGIEASAFIYEKPDGTVKASMRSKKINVSAIAEKYGGGGHIMAAGVSFYNSDIETVRKIIVEEFKEAMK